MSFNVSTRCECQAILSATLDERRIARDGRASYRGAQIVAPSHSIGATLERFDVAWLCPFCGRNTIRSFDAGGLAAASEPDASEPDAAASASQT
jgi:hypothetical protein